jgi:hypothetical protein
MVKNKLNSIKKRQENKLDGRQVIALESFPDNLKDIFFKLHEMNSKM